MNITEQLLKRILDQLVELNERVSSIEASQRDGALKESKAKKAAKKKLLTEAQKDTKPKMTVQRAVNSILTKKIFDSDNN